MNLIQRPKEYSLQMNSKNEFIDYDFYEHEKQINRTWANVHIVAIVGVIALTVISVSNNNRDIEVSKNQVRHTTNDNKPYYNFKAVTGD